MGGLKGWGGDFMVGLGGGCCIDRGKGMGMVVKNGEFGDVG